MSKSEISNPMNRMALRVSAFLPLIVLLASGPLTLHAQSAQAVAASTRVTTEVNPVQLSRLQGHVPAWAIPANDQGPLDSNKAISNMHLVLSRAPQVEAAFQQLLADQQNPSSPRYHQWLTPQQNAEQFGIADSDVAAVTRWLESQNLTVDNVASGGVFITFSGHAADLERAFSVALRNYTVGTKVQYSISDEPSVPAALSAVVHYVSGLSEQTMERHSARKAKSDFQPFATSSSGSHSLAPADFNTIYDITPLLNSGYTGSGQHAAVIIDSRVSASDITAFDSFFGLTTSTVNQTLVPNTGTDPGLGAGEGEADLDVQRILGTAPSTQVDLLVISSLSNTYIQTALQYNNTQLNDAVLNMSFGGCTYGESASQAAVFDSYFSTGSAQGISYFASSGDNGAAACNANYNSLPSTQVLATNYPCSSVYVTCVGGTEFNDTTNASTYWSSSNNSTTKQSVLSYIPEGAWNEPTLTGSTPYTGLGTGGGVSQFTKPTWQTGNGVPSDGFRDVPDVSFTASGHDGYLVCESDAGGNCSTGSFQYVILGTSASSPSMAGVAVLLNQRLGSRQGNLNPLIYKLAASTPAAFHDATPTTSGVSSCTTSTPSMCNNSTPTSSSLSGGLPGYPLTTGYDLSTGWGSLDVNSFITAALATATPTFTISPASSSLTVNAGSSVTDVMTFASVNSFSGSVALTCTVTNSSGTAAGTCSLLPTPVTLSAGGTTTSTLTVNATSGTSGTLNVTVTGTSGSTVVTSSSIAVTVNASTFTVTPALTSLSSSGSAVTDTITVASINGFSSAVALTCTVTNASGTAAGGCSLNPTSVTPASGGSTTSTLTVTPTAGTSGTLNVTVTGTSGSTVITSSTIVVTLTIPTFTVTPASTALSLSTTAGASVTDTITVASVNGFNSAVALTCKVTSGTGNAAGTCSLNLSPVTPAANGSTTSTLTITPSAANLYGSLNVTVTGTSGSTVITSSTIVLTLTNPNATFTLTPTSTSLSFTAGSASSNTDTVTVASTNGYTGTVSLACTIALNSGTATLAPTCSVSPSSVSLTAVTTGSGTATVTIGSQAASTTCSTANDVHVPWDIRGTALAACLLVLLPFRKRKPVRKLLALCVFLGGLAWLTGCGGGGTPTACTNHTVAGTTTGSYTVTVTGNSSVSTTFTVTIN